MNEDWNQGEYSEESEGVEEDDLQDVSRKLENRPGASVISRRTAETALLVSCSTQRNIAG